MLRRKVWFLLSLISLGPSAARRNTLEPLNEWTLTSYIPLVHTIRAIL